MRGGRRGRMCYWWPAATDPLTRKKCSGDVLLAGGLALGCLTSEVRARQRKGRFLWSEPGGLDQTLGWRESVPGEGVAPQGGESLPAAGEELGAARSGNTEQVLEGSACPPSPGARLASPLVSPSEEKPEGPSVPLCPPGQSCLSLWEAPPSGSPCVPGALDRLLLFYGAWGLCLPSTPPCTPGSLCSLSALGSVPAKLPMVGAEVLAAFQGIFPGSWPRLTAWLFGQGCSRV